MVKKRIYELAKELSVSSVELLKYMADLSIMPGANLGPSNSVEEKVAEEIKAKVTQIKQANQVMPVVKRRKKAISDTSESEESEIDSEESASWSAGPARSQGFAEGQKSQDSPPGPAAPALSAGPGASPSSGQPARSGQGPSAEPAQAQASAPKPVTVPPKKFDKATIIGTQEINPQPGSRDQGKGSGAAEQIELPDFMKLSPTQSEQPRAPEAVLATPAPLAPEALSAEESKPWAQTQEPEPKSPVVEVASQDKAHFIEDRVPKPENHVPFWQRSTPGSGPGASQAKSYEQGSTESPAAQPTTGEPVRRRGGIQRTVELQDTDRAGGLSRVKSSDRNKRVNRDLTQARTLLNSEAARVVGVAKSFSAPSDPQNKANPNANRFYPVSRPPANIRGVSVPARTGPEQKPLKPEDREESRKRRAAKKTSTSVFTERGAEDLKKAKRRDYAVDRTDLYSEGVWERARPKKSKAKKTKAKTEITIPKPIKRRIKVDEVITVSELAHRLSLKVGDIIKKLMSLGVMAGLNQSLDFDTATLVAAEFGYDVEKSSFDEGDFLPLPDVEEKYSLVPRSPVVTIMGHVDHGKTSLLDYIRKTKIQEGEAGGITQHIGAYHVKVGQSYITFLDTPGHEAFTAMRSRGAQVTDIVILIVAADDGVMPQTREAADHAKAAKVPIIVAVNKIDKPGADPERIRRQMMELGLTQEAWGGDTVFVDISAKTGHGVDELLEMILLQADLLELKARVDGPAKGRIVEARLDKGRGAMATVLVEEGTLKQGDTYVCGVFYGKIRAMFDDNGLKLQEAGPAIPVEIQGISGIPQAGDEFIVMEDEKQAKQVSQHRLLKQRESVLVKSSKLTLENLFDHIKAGAVKGLNLIIKADVQGSLEAILDAVGKFSTPEIKITVIHSAIGIVSETDIMLASASNALIICFGVKPPSIKVQEVAEAEQVQVRYYDVIYKLLEDIKEAMAGLLDPIKNIKIVGQIDVRAVFNITKVGQVAGCYVTDGKVNRGARAKVLRDKEVIFDGRVGSLKREKNDVREVLAGYECGLSLEGFSDVQEGDRIEIYQIEETAATVDLINEAVERVAANKEAAAQAEAAAQLELVK